MCESDQTLSRKDISRLTEGPNAPKDKNPDDFHTCWVCGKTYEDICNLRMFIECNDADENEDGNYILICQGKKCWRTMQEHPRLYKEIRWGGTKAGALILLCGDCTHRKGFKCTHPDRIKNGGEGLHAYATKPLGNFHISYTDGRSARGPLYVIDKCEGSTPKRKGC